MVMRMVRIYESVKEMGFTLHMGHWRMSFKIKGLAVNENDSCRNSLHCMDVQ